jgi:hypothetical protein
LGDFEINAPIEDFLNARALTARLEKVDRVFCRSVGIGRILDGRRRIGDVLAESGSTICLALNKSARTYQRASNFVAH